MYDANITFMQLLHEVNASCEAQMHECGIKN